MGYMTAGTSGVILTGGNTVFNEASADKDFRIESDGNTHQLFVDAGNDRLGIGTSTPISTVDIEDGLTTVGAVLTLSTKEPTVVDADVIGRINFRAPLETGADALLVLASIHAEADATFDATTNSTELVFSTAAGDAAVERVRIASDGKVGIGTATPDHTLEVEGEVHITSTGAGNALLIESTEDSAAAAPDIMFFRNRTPANGNDIAMLRWRSKSNAGNTHDYADIFVETEDVADGAEDGKMQLRTSVAGTMTKRITIDSTGVGIGNDSPVSTLDVTGDVRFRASVEICTSDPAAANIETGTVYQFTKGSAGVFTLPASPPVGTQFVLVNGSANDIVITRPHSSVIVNGATSNVTNTTAYAATSIVAVVSNGNSSEWLVFGGI